MSAIGSQMKPTATGEISPVAVGLILIIKILILLYFF
jgi:hypothetical protein